MILQLDPGFTNEGFGANLLLAALGSFVGTIGAFLVAWLIYRRSSRDERNRFEHELAHNRNLLQETFDHDIRMRREEDASRRFDRDELEQLERRRLWIALLTEFDGNVQAIEFMRVNQPSRIPLRRSLLDVSLGYIGELPRSVGALIQLSSLHIDQSNAVPQGSPMYPDSLIIAKRTLEDAATLIALYLKGDVSYDNETEDV